MEENRYLEQVNSIFSQLVIDLWGEYTVNNNDYLSKNHLKVQGTTKSTPPPKENYIKWAYGHIW